MNFLAGIGVPSPNLGANGDDYYNIVAGAVYNKASGTWSPKFTATSGNYFRSGSGVPDNALGIDDDYYINLINSDLYEKVSGVWVLRYRKGGSTGWYSGVGAPGFEAGNGDHYFDTATGNLYQYVDGTWTLIYTASSGGVTAIQTSVTASSYSYALANKWLVGWELVSTAASSPRLGITSGGDELGSVDGLPIGTQWVGQGNMVTTLSAQTIYFSNLSGNTTIKIWLISA